MLYVASSIANRRTWSAAKEAFVATSRVGVGPGVKMESQRFWELVQIVYVLVCAVVVLLSCTNSPAIAA
jgi:hypothetical protein